VEMLMEGEASEAEIACFLTALRVRGETVDELVGTASALREKQVPFFEMSSSSPPTEAIDTCGTGGDGLQTFNISTASAFVVAACGMPVAKHGNKAVSSKCGSADVLTRLGMAIDIPPERAAKGFHEWGIAFFFAPVWHPAVKNVMPVRRALGFRTIFNLVGPLANPVGVAYQLVGVGEKRWLSPLAQALALLKTRSATVVHGSDGLDEVTLTGSTSVAYFSNWSSEIQTTEWTPDDFGLPTARLTDWQVEGADDSAQIIQAVLKGEQGPCRDIVLANSAATLWTSGRTSDLKQGVEQARDAIDSRRAWNLLQNLCQWTKVGNGGTIEGLH
jgi:anthranilate phosphoribosyltransferase